MDHDPVEDSRLSVLTGASGDAASRAAAGHRGHLFERMEEIEHTVPLGTAQAPDTAPT